VRLELETGANRALVSGPWSSGSCILKGPCLRALRMPSGSKSIMAINTCDEMNLYEAQENLYLKSRLKAYKKKNKKLKKKLKNLLAPKPAKSIRLAKKIIKTCCTVGKMIPCILSLKEIMLNQ
jgi:hypothetical protein